LYKDNPTRIPLWEVETDKNYALIISNNSGLLGYIIGDTVRFISTFPHRIQVSGRVKQFLSAFGEHLIIEEVEKAIQFACQESGADVAEYTIGPSPINPDNRFDMYHEYLIEFRKPPRTGSAQQFALLVDLKLKQLNEDYEIHRKGQTGLKDPRVHVLPEGTLIEWLKHSGRASGQAKVPRLNNDRRFLDPILEYLKEQGIENE